jgi:hypothetical protein
MPIYMDRHYIEGATRHTIANAHEKFPISGHFQLPDGYPVDSLSLRLEVILKDVFERQHTLLPLAGSARCAIETSGPF